MRTYGVNQEFRIAKGICLHRKRRQIRFFSRKRFFLHHTCAICSELPSYLKAMILWGNYNVSGQVCCELINTREKVIHKKTSKMYFFFFNFLTVDHGTYIK